REVLVPVAKLQPGGAASPGVTCDEAGRSRRRPGAPSGFYQAHQSTSVDTRVDTGARDLGVALNDYLLARLELDESEALYESQRISLRRHENERPVDIFELYWADLSRVGTGGWRALSALYQLFFHLGTLAADIVDQVALSVGGGPAWRLLQRMHAWLAWLMKGPAALVQLAMLLLVAFGVLGLVSPDQVPNLLAALLAAASVGLTALAALAWLRGRSPAARWTTLLALLVAALACPVAVVIALTADRGVPTMYFAASALSIAALGVWLTERYAGIAHGVRLVGQVIVGATVLALAVDGRVLLPQITTQAEWMLTAALNVGEVLLAALLLVWAAYAAVQLAALALSLSLGRGVDDAARRSLNTARLAIVSSTALFTVLSLVLWSMIGYVFGRRLADFHYLPLMFGSGYRSGDIFIDDRIRTVGAFFTPMVLAFAVLAAATLVVLMPSLLEEVRPSTNVDARGPRPEAVLWTQRLGEWLGDGLRWLRVTFTAAVPPGAMLGGALYLAFVYRQFRSPVDAGGEVVRWGETLVAAGKWLAGGALTLAALGTRFTETLGRLRVGIDAVLDIDNYFRDPPDRQPPRA